MSARSRYRPWFLDGAVRPNRTFTPNRRDPLVPPGLPLDVLLLLSERVRIGSLSNLGARPFFEPLPLRSGSPSRLVPTDEQPNPEDRHS